MTLSEALIKARKTGRGVTRHARGKLVVAFGRILHSRHEWGDLGWYWTDPVTYAPTFEDLLATDWRMERP